METKTEKGFFVDYHEAYRKIDNMSNEALLDFKPDNSKGSELVQLIIDQILARRGLINKEIAKFVGIDCWNRAVFIDKFNNYYCTINEVYSQDETPNLLKITEVCFKGRCFEDEPHWNVNNIILSL